MLLFDQRLLFQFTDYGILIPIKDSKILRVLEHLSSVPKLQDKEWKTTPIHEVVSKSDLVLAHSKAYINRIYGPECEEEILKSYELIDRDGQFHRYAPEAAQKPLIDFFNRILLHVAGTTQACRKAKETGFCYFLGGGMHHGHYDYGTGFCLVNDIVIAIKKLQYEKVIEDAWIVDVDAHKGDGTAALTQGDDSILTLSIHMGSGWPLDEETTAERGSKNDSLIPSDVEIAMFEGEDSLYNSRLEKGLKKLRELAYEKRGRLPDLVLVVHGSDPYEKDELPSTKSMRLTLEQLLERDLLLDHFFTSLHLPTAYVSAGGYGDAVWEVYAQFLERILPRKLNG